MTDGIKKGHCFGEVIWARIAIIQEMAMMLKVFNIESEYSLMPRLGEISDDESLKKVSSIVIKGLGEKRDMDPIESIIGIPKISDVQIALREFVEKSSNGAYVGHKSEFKMGASVMFGILSEFKSKLFPPKPTQPDSSLPQAPTA